MSSAAAIAKEPHFFYSARVPAEDENVMAEISAIHEAAVYATLPAYGNLEGMIPMTEVGIPKRKRVTDVVRVGQLVVANVKAVTESGALDLSLKNVRPDEREAATTRYHQDLRLNNIVRSTAGGGDRELQEYIYTKFAWPATEGEAGVSSAAWLERIRVGEIGVAEGLPRPFVEEVMLRVPMPSYTESTDITVRFGVFHNGAERLNSFLRELAAEPGIQVIVTAPPKYRLTATDVTQEKAAARLAAAVGRVPPVC